VKDSVFSRTGCLPFCFDDVVTGLVSVSESFTVNRITLESNNVKR